MSLLEAMQKGENNPNSDHGPADGVHKGHFLNLWALIEEIGGPKQQLLRRPRSLLGIIPFHRGVEGLAG